MKVSNLFNEDKIDLFNEIIDKDNISSFLEDEIVKGMKPSDVQMFINVLENLDEYYKWSLPRKVLIPKDEAGNYREIFVFNDKDSLLLKFINFIFNSKLGHLVSDNVSSYKKGKSVFDAVSKVKKNIKNIEVVNYVKADISKYFNSVNQVSIFRCIEDLVSDIEGQLLLKSLFFINEYVDKEGNVFNEYLGLMPGSALSAFMSNYMLNQIDDYLSSNLEFYVRYSDDILIVDKTKSKLDKSIKILSSMLKSYGLSLNKSKLITNYNAQSIEFLGLKITRESIDMSDKNFKKLKNGIKSICKSSRTRYELDSKNSNYVNIDNYVKSAIDKINRFLYSSYFQEDGLHKNSKLTYIFRNVTTDETIKELDFYICDRLRYVYTGVNNKANASKVTTRKLEMLGYHSSVQLYNCSKLSKDIFSIKLNGILNKPFSFNSIVDCEVPIVHSLFVTNAMSFYTFVYNCYSKHYKLMMNGKAYSLDELEVNYISKSIKLDGELLVSYDKYVFEGSFGAYKDGKFLKYITNDKLYQDGSLADLNTLVEMYRNTYLDDFQIKDLNKYNPYKYFIKIPHTRFYLEGFNKNLNLSSPVMFSLSLYCWLFKLPKEYKEKEFVVLGSKIPLVFESKLIP